ncbi:MAG: tetratricopeptide repeat protein [Candidatus Odinarchaeota archaeon]
MGFEWNSYTINEIPLETIFEIDRKFTFLAGSGVSLEKPSCLPTGYQFVEKLLDQTVPNEEKSTILSLTNPERTNRGDFIRFEELMELAQYWLDLRTILDIYASTSGPNLNHRILSRFLIAGHSIFTTNFDSLLEYALLEENIDKQHLIPAIREEDWRYPTKENQEYFIYKLHGSLIDIRDGLECLESLQATLSQITRANGQPFELVEWKRTILDHFLKKQDMIVVGYSGLDDFDILPTLKKITTSKKLIWISHEKCSLENAEIEIIQEKNEKITVENQKKSRDRLGSELLSFCSLDPSKKALIFRIHVDTSEILAWLHKRYINGLLPEVKQSECSEFSFPLGIESQDFDKWFLAAQIYKRRNLIEKSIHSYEQALSLAKQADNLQVMAECYNNTALMLKNQGKRKLAMDYYYKALGIAKTLNIGEASILNNIGSIYKAEGNFKEAMKFYKEALNLLKERGIMDEMTSVLNNIGSVLIAQERHKEALNFLEKSLDIAKTQGDLHNISSTLDNIGTLYRNQNQHDKAMENYTEALRVAGQLGDLRGEATCLNNLTSYLASQSKLDQALENYKRMLEIDEQLGDIENKATTLNNIASIYQRKKEPARALTLLFQALEIDESLNNLEGKTERLINIGVIFINNGNKKEAKKYMEEALVIAEELGIPTQIERAREGLNRISEQYLKN